MQVQGCKLHLFVNVTAPIDSKGLQAPVGALDIFYSLSEFWEIQELGGLGSSKSGEDF
jgi:hypothetical protein